MLEIVTFTLGPAQTNAYLVADQKHKKRQSLIHRGMDASSSRRRKIAVGASVTSGIHTHTSITLAERLPLRMR